MGARVALLSSPQASGAGGCGAHDAVDDAGASAGAPRPTRLRDLGRGQQLGEILNVPWVYYNTHGTLASLCTHDTDHHHRHHQYSNKSSPISSDADRDHSLYPDWSRAALSTPPARSPPPRYLRIPPAYSLGCPGPPARVKSTSPAPKAMGSFSAAYSAGSSCDGSVRPRRPSSSAATWTRFGCCWAASAWTKRWLGRGMSKRAVGRGWTGKAGTTTR